MNQTFVSKKKMAPAILEPIRKFKKRDASMNESFNLNMIKSKYNGLENFLDENYSRKNVPKGMNATDQF